MKSHQTPKEIQLWCSFNAETEVHFVYVHTCKYFNLINWNAVVKLYLTVCFKVSGVKQILIFYPYCIILVFQQGYFHEDKLNNKWQAVMLVKLMRALLMLDSE